MADNITFQCSGRTYTWDGGFGSIISSYERGIKEGQTRVIEGYLFYAYHVYGRKVCWSVIDIDHEKIAKIKRKFLGV